jgi:type I restriction enzyme S subunit
MVAEIKRQTSHVADAGTRAEREVDLLREYRMRLVADVVTGKLDVRDVAAGLPEDVGEPDVRDEVDTEADVEPSDDLDAVEAEAQA